MKAATLRFRTSCSIESRDRGRGRTEGCGKALSKSSGKKPGFGLNTILPNSKTNLNVLGPATRAEGIIQGPSTVWPSMDGTREEYCSTPRCCADTSRSRDRAHRAHLDLRLSNQLQWHLSLVTDTSFWQGILKQYRG